MLYSSFPVTIVRGGTVVFTDRVQNGTSLAYYVQEDVEEVLLLLEMLR